MSMPEQVWYRINGTHFSTGAFCYRTKIPKCQGLDADA
jgi:hypothetical protein